MRKIKIGDYPQLEYTVFYLPDDHVTPYVVAWGYNPSRGEWLQGHYFHKLASVAEYLISKAEEAGVKI